ncbi:MAG: hypothetical protein J1F12_08845 [Muribaculaceae bacterium]|nr:hypothetical protein [Muribaculaceae bacterium]
MKLISNIRDYIYNSVIKKCKPVLNLVGLVSLLMAGLVSCSDDTDFSSGVNPENQHIVIQFALPDMTSVLTRATTDKDLNTIDVFVFGQGVTPDEFSTFITHEYYDQKKIVDNTISLNLSSDVRGKDVLLYVVANGDDGVKNIGSLEELRKYIISSPISLEAGLPMIGSKKVNTLSTLETLVLYRTVAKVTAECEDEAKAKLNGLQIYNNATTGYIASPLNIEDTYSDYVFGDNVVSDPSSVVFGSSNLIFTYPSKGFNYNDHKSGAFVIVSVTRNEKEQYYRLNLRYEDEDDKLKYLDILPNHHYQIIIKGFFSDGYDNPEDAAKHPEADQYVVYTIHDHASEVLSMVTDGYNELGVTPEITLTSSTDPKTVVVKCYSPDGEVKPEDIKIEEDGSNWLEITYKGFHSSTGDYHTTWDSDNPGQQFEYEISIKSGSKNYEDLEGKIVVSWNNLKRTVKVNFESIYLLPETSTVTLKIYEDGNESKEPYATIEDYWTFVTGAGNNKEGKDGKGPGSEATPKLWGIQPENMVNAKKRINGFHFPMPYGENHSSNPWTYVYTVDFNKFITEGEAKSIQGIEISTSGDDFLKDKIDYSKVGNVVTLRFNGDKTSYEYAGGKITFRISYTDSNDGSATVDVSPSLYHTGFFHYEGDGNYVPSEKRGYYYYEVVPLGKDGNDNTMYWLDRNIGATANHSYIDIEDNNTEGKDAAGNHYTIINRPKDYNLPEWDFHMIPPGYHIPNSTEWDYLRLHDNFKTQSYTIKGTLFMSTFYESENNKIGNIYFQKARFCNRKNIYQETQKYSASADEGDAGAGYYWSLTEAPAMEKEQMGNWLRALYLNGSASAYNNASVTDHRMPIRCKAGNVNESSTAQDYYISFNVHEVTHVYLFDKNTKTALYKFPGRAVGTYASADKWQHFSCALTQDPDHLLMLFVKLNSDGTLIVYRKTGENLTFGSENYKSFEGNNEYDKEFLNDTYAWEIEKGKYYDFCSVGEKREKNPFDKGDTDEWANNCGFTQGSGNTDPDPGTDPDPKPGVNLDDYKFTIEDPEKETDQHINKDYIEDNGWYQIQSINWNNVQPGSTLRIYTVAYKQDDYEVIIRDGWNNPYGTIHYSDTHIYQAENTTQAIIDIILTTDLLNIFRERGFVLDAKECILLGMTIINADGSVGGSGGNEGDQTIEPDDPNEKIILSGNNTIGNWNGIVVNYDWNSVPAGSVLKVYAYPLNPNSNNWYCVSFRLNDSSWSNLLDSGTQWDNPNGTKSITLDQNLINKLSSNGLLLTGVNSIIKLVTISIP